MGNRRILVVVLGAVLGAAAALVLPASARGNVTPASVVDTQANLPDPVAELEAAEQAAPYTIHLPDPLPDGTVPLVVDSVQENGVTSVDIWWTLPGSSRFHIWQTNNPSLAAEGKDVLSSGTAVMVGNTSWQQTATSWGQLVMNELCRRFDDGVTLCISSNLDPPWVSSVAATIK